MTRTVRWLLVIAGALVVFGLCVWLGDVVLPWDRPERIATGAGAGAVIAGLLGAAAGSMLGSAPSPTPSPAAGQQTTASGERAVATGDNSGVIVTGDGGTVQR